MSSSTNTRTLSTANSPTKMYRVMHSSSGRIRIQIPKLLENPICQIKLKDLIQSFNFVTDVRINPTAKSIIIHYTNTGSTQQQLIDAIEQVININISTNPSSNSNLNQIKLDHSFTAYEQNQIEQIKEWESKEPDFLSNLAGKLFSPINKVLDLIIPATVLEAGLKAADVATSKWQEDWDELKQTAQLPDDCNFTDLEFCDRLVDQVENKAIAIAGIEGGIAGILEWVGEIVDIPLSVGLALKTIHKIGLCYGYAPQTQSEKQFAWAVLGIGTANTTEERKTALEVLQNLQNVLYRQTIDDTIENSVEESLFESTMDSLIQQSIANLTEEYSITALPLLGVGLGVVVNSLVMAEVSTSARRAFQIRWLLENRNLSSELNALKANDQTYQLE